MNDARSGRLRRLWRTLVVSAGMSLAAASFADRPASDAPPAVGSVTLHYRAFVAGAPVGEASITLSLGDGGYEISGEARSDGWLEGFSDWRNRFFARGGRRDAGPVLREFRYRETDGDERRDVVVRSGVLQVTKNGRERPQRTAPAGPDLISALFVEPRCRDEQAVHTGRHSYRLRRLDTGPAACRYRVLDEDDETFRMDLVLGRYAGVIVPRRITVHAWLTGWVELESVESVAATLDDHDA